MSGLKWKTLCVRKKAQNVEAKERLHCSPSKASSAIAGHDDAGATRLADAVSGRTSGRRDWKDERESGEDRW